MWNTSLLRVEVGVTTLGRRVGRGSRVLVGPSALPDLHVGMSKVSCWITIFRATNESWGILSSEEY